MYTATDLTQEHYSRPEIKDVICSHALMVDGRWRALNGDFSTWYKYLDNNQVRLLNAKDDYDWITSHFRVLYQTLNVFDHSLQSEIRNKLDVSSEIPLGSPKETAAYTLGVDIDKGPGFKLDECISSLENATQFLIDELKINGINKSVWSLFSGGGIYVEIHHEICKPSQTCLPEDREVFYQILTDSFNNFIQSISDKFFIKYPDEAGRVKFDALNNSKRVFKCILSIHKKNPYAVIPLNRDNIRIDLEKAKIPLKDDIIIEARNWYSGYDANEKEALFKLLENFRKEEYSTKKTFSEIYRSPNKITEFPPCIRHIIDVENRSNGKTRFSGVLSTYLYEAGWTGDESWDLVQKVSKRNALSNARHIFDSCYGQISCPSCQTIQNDGTGYPHLGLRNLGVCKPDKACWKWPTGFGKRPRPTIIIGSDLIELVEETADILYKYNSPAAIYQRGGVLARIKQVDLDQQKIEDLSVDAMRNEISRAANFAVIKEVDGMKFSEPRQPPLYLAKGIMALGSWNVPIISGIINAPVIREDGSILSSEGYDSSTRLFYANNSGLEMPDIPDNLTQKDAQEAAKYFYDEVLHDFPFIDEISKANTLAAFLTMIVRPMIKGCVPLALIDKPAPGTGASKILELISIVATGKAMAAVSPPDNEEEWRKQITSWMRDGTPIICIDNIAADLKADTLARVLSSSIWKDRTLGKPDAMEYPQRSCWFATGNNIILSGDLPRRSYLTQMDAKMARPWERDPDKFRHPSINEWVKENRGQVLASLLIMAKAWVLAGNPNGCKAIIGGFDEWVHVVGGILNYAGIKDFLGNLNKLYEEVDEGGDEWKEFFEKWFELHPGKGLRSSDLCEELQERESPLGKVTPIEIGEIIKFRSPGNPRKIAKILRKKQNVVYGKGLKLIKEEGRSNFAVWKIIKMEDQQIC
jgi:hypothetical protein